MLRMLWEVRRTTTTPIVVHLSLAETYGHIPLASFGSATGSFFFGCPPGFLVLSLPWGLLSSAPARYRFPPLAIHPADMRALAVMCGLPPAVGESVNIPSPVPFPWGQRCNYLNWIYPTLRLPTCAFSFCGLMLLSCACSISFAWGTTIFPLTRCGHAPSGALHLRFCDMSHWRLLGEEHHFVFDCPALQLQHVRDLFRHPSHHAAGYVAESSDCCCPLHC